MKNDFTLADYVSDNIIATIRSLEDLHEAKFTDCVAHLGLNPATDFRHADLSFVNFDNCDLRSYDFRGADLRGATGRNVIWDATTNLEGAQLSGSIFAYERQRAQFFEAHPQWRQRLSRLKAETWAAASIWVAENVGMDGRNRDEAIEVAKALFEETHDAVLQTNILLFMGRAFDRRDQHRDYILYLIARYGSDRRVFNAAITALASLFTNDIQAFSILLRVVCNPKDDHQTRVRAFQALMRSKYFRQAIPEISGLVAGFSEELRRLYVGHVASLFGDYYLDAVREPHTKTFLDFHDEVTNAKIHEIARYNLRHEMARESEGRAYQVGAFNLPEPKENKVEARAAVVRELIVDLGTKGIPFRVQRAPAPKKEQAVEQKAR